MSDQYFFQARNLKSQARGHAMQGVMIYGLIAVATAAATLFAFVYALAWLVMVEHMVLPISAAVVAMLWGIGIFIEWQRVPRVSLADGELWLKRVDVGKDVKVDALEIWMWFEIVVFRIGRIILLFSGWATVQAWRELRAWRAVAKVSEAELSGAIAALVAQQNRSTVHDFAANMARPALVLTALDAQPGVLISGKEAVSIAINDELRAKWAG